MMLTGEPRTAESRVTRRSAGRLVRPSATAPGARRRPPLTATATAASRAAPSRRRSASGRARGTAGRRPATSCPRRSAGRCRRRTAATDSSSGPAPARSAASTSAAGTSASTIRATSSLATGKRRDRRHVPAGGAAAISASRSISAAAVRAGSPNAAHDLGMQLAGVADRPSPPGVANSAHRPGCQGARSAGPADQRRRPTAAAATSARTAIACCQPAGYGRALPAGRPPVARSARRRRCLGWSPERRVHGGELGRRTGRPVDRRARRGTRRLGGEEHRAGLEQGQVVVAAAACCGRRRRTARAAAWSAGTGVVSASGLAIRFSRRRSVVGRQPEPVQLVGRRRTGSSAPRRSRPRPARR